MQVRKEEWSMRKLLAVIFALAFIGCAQTTVKAPKKYEPEMVQHFKGSIFTATDTGYYTAELIIRPNPPVMGVNKADLIIHDYRAQDIEGLDISITAYMPDTGTASPETCIVKDVGRGLYAVENLHYHKPGAWELKVQIKGPQDDTVVLKLPEVK